MVEKENELLKENAKLRAQVQALKARKKFGLTFEFKTDDAVDAVSVSIPVIIGRDHGNVEAPSGGVVHELIKGDNFQALTAMLPAYKGKVGVIYIDPPYNTGNKDFIYDDRFVDGTDRFRHSKWLSFMKPRLELAREMLSDDGVIFVSIDDNEQAHLRMLMDEIFGEGNFVANIVWKGGRTNNAKRVSSGHDYILTYAKNVSNLPIWREEKAGTERIYAAGKSAYDEAVRTVQRPLEDSVTADYIYHKNIEEKATSIFKKWWKNLDKDDPAQENKHYNRIDGWTGRVFFGADITSPTYSKNNRYDVRHPITKKPVPMPSRGYRYTRQKMTELIADNLIYFGTDETRSINIKRFLDDVESRTPDSVFYVDRRAAQQEMKRIVGEDIFDFPKDVNVLKRWIRIAAQKNALVLDFFAGSGTTLQAVAELNAEDGGTRKCVLVTSSGKPDETGVDIADDVTYERCRRVLTGKDWADGKDHPSLEQGLKVSDVVLVSTLDTLETPPVDLVDSDIVEDVVDVADMSQKEAKSAVREWKRVRNNVRRWERGE